MMTLELMFSIMLTKGERLLVRNHRKFTLSNYTKHSDDESSEDNIDELEKLERGKYFDKLL